MNDFALVIGIDHYATGNKGLTRLNGAKDDAYAIAKWLVEKDGGGLDKENCRIVTSRYNPLQPFHPQITTELQLIVEKAQDLQQNSNRLYFYFAGHGVVEELEFDEVDYETGLCLANWTEIARRAALSAREYRKILIRSGLFKEIVILADCCRNPKIKVKGLPPEIDFEDKVGPHQKPRVFVAYSSQTGEPSYEIPDEEGKMRGAFTTVLMEALKGGAVNEAGCIDGNSLQGYLEKRLPEVTQRKYNVIQKPQILNGFKESVLNCKRKDMSGTVECRITLTSGRKSIIYLVNENGEDIMNLDPANTPQFLIPLAKGEYLLEDRNTYETISISVNPLLSTEAIEVEF
jgi:uncharacterized caspase-like protein